jgi:hypothetical protein
MGATALFVIAGILTAMSALVAWTAESVQLHAAEQTS